MTVINTINGRFRKLPCSEWGPSVTTIVNKLTETPIHLLQWYCDMGYKAATEYRDAAAAYGTIFHAVVKEYLTRGSITKSEIINFVELFLSLDDYVTKNITRLYENILSKNSPFWTRLLKDLVAFELWLRDKKVTPIAIEQIVTSDKYHAGGCVDLVCELNFNKKRVTAIVDFKTGKHIYEIHGLQLCLYAELWEDQYPTIKIDMLFNWKPKDWLTSPTYDFVNQSDFCDREKAKLYFALAKKSIIFVPPKSFHFSDDLIFSLTSDNDLHTPVKIEDMYSISYQN